MAPVGRLHYHLRVAAPQLPGPMSFDDFEAFRRQPQLWWPVAEDLARRHRTTALEPFEKGSNLVAALDGQRVLKIFPPMLLHQFESERRTLAALAGRLSVATPEPLAEGERDGWSYLIMSRLPGRTADQVWPTLSEAGKVALLGRLGRLISEVQAQPVGALASLPPAWPDFLKAQRAGCRGRHEGLGLAPTLLEGLEVYLDEAIATFAADRPPVILTGEYIGENLMLGHGPTGWELTGLFDFGDVMTGHCEYDLLGPSMFLAAGHPARVRALLEGFAPGLSADPGVPQRLTALMLLHRFSDLKRQIAIEDWPTRATTLRALERLLWPTSPSAGRAARAAE